MSRLFALLRPVLVLLLIFSEQFQVGLMPAKGADGQMIMVICSGDGPMMMVLDPVTGAFHKAPSDTRKSGCDWVGAHAAIAPETVLPVLMAQVQAVAPVIEADLWRPAHDPRGIWARGPPRLM